MRLHLRIVVSSVLVFALAACSVIDLDGTPAPPLTEAQAKKALFTVADFPKGWTRDADESTDDIKMTRGSKACKRLVGGDDDVDGADDADTTTFLDRSFSSPDESTSIGHSIESYAEGEAWRAFNRGVMMIDDCDKFTMADSTGLSIRFTLGLVHFKDMGDDSVAFQAVASVSGIKFFMDSAAVRVGQNIVSITSFRIGSAIPDRKMRNYLKRALAKLEKVA